MTPIIFMLTFMVMGAFLFRWAGGGFKDFPLDLDQRRYVRSFDFKFFQTPGFHFNLTWLPEFCLSVFLAATTIHTWSIFELPDWVENLVFLGLIVWFLNTIQAGIGIALPWGAETTGKPELDEDLKKRKHKISKLVKPLAKLLGIQERIDGTENSLYTKNYCRLHMAVKGALIGLPLLPVGFLVMAVMFPLAYEIGNRSKGWPEMPEKLKGNSLSELTAGAVAFGWAAFMHLATFNAIFGG